jgi:hypothetical protein
MKLASRGFEDDLGSGSEGLGDFVKNEESSVSQHRIEYFPTMLQILL